MNTLQLIIDQRERELKLHFEEKANVLIQTLDIGDIVFKCGEDTVLIIERKTINDLSASICDGRHREQKARLLGSGIHKNRIMYLIEGNINKMTRVKGGTDTLIGSVINTQLRDGIKVYKTTSLQETVKFVEKLFDKLQKDGEKYWKYENNHEVSVAKYSSTLKTKKKANMTPDVWLHTQLVLIPQVTGGIATEIMKVYPTLRELVCAYEEIDESVRESLLQDIKYPLSSGKERRIGSKVSARIYNFVYGLE